MILRIMNNRTGLVVIIVLLLVIIIGFVVLLAIPGKTEAPIVTGDVTPQPVATTTSQTTSTIAVIDDLIEVTAPVIDATISSPLTVTGQARGTWYFEASAPYELRNSVGTVISQGHIDAQGDWMTEEFVPFKATIQFTKQKAGTTGTLVLRNDNPSGDPDRDRVLEIPVKF